MKKRKQKQQYKESNGKPRLSLIPIEALYAMGIGFSYGEKKYHTHSFREGNIDISYLLDAAARHSAQFSNGEDFDNESGNHHLGSAMCNLAMAIHIYYNNPENDDRFKRKKK